MRVRVRVSWLLESGMTSTSCVNGAPLRVKLTMRRSTGPKTTRLDAYVMHMLCTLDVILDVILDGILDGILDVEEVDVDADVDVHVHVHVHADADADADAICRCRCRNVSEARWHRLRFGQLPLR